MAALTALVASSAVAVPAAATGPASGRVARASRVVQQAAVAALAESAGTPRASAPAPQVVPEGVQKEALSVAKAKAAAPSAPERPQPPTPTCRLGEGCSYKTLLGYLVITKDLEIPGAPGMALRLIPTRSALAGGASSPIVLKPRVVGTSWSGLEIAAQF